jgi:hypothetical protein
VKFTKRLLGNNKILEELGQYVDLITDSEDGEEGEDGSMDGEDREGEESLAVAATAEENPVTGEEDGTVEESPPRPGQGGRGPRMIGYAVDPAILGSI